MLDDDVVEAGSKGVMLALTGAAGVALGAWAFLAQGCTVNSCQGVYIVLDCDPGGPCPNPRFPPAAAPGMPEPEHGLRPANASTSADGHEWQTGMVTDTWLPFPAQRSYRLFTNLPESTPPTSIIPYVSVSETADHDQWVVAAGNLAEFSYLFFDADHGGWTFAVHNDTCANYYLRVVVRADGSPPPAEADAGAPDGAADGDTITDADASLDASDGAD